MEVKPINKRASGQAFEVILKPLSPVSEGNHNFPSPPKRDISLDDIEKKLEAAEDRRRVSILNVSNHFRCLTLKTIFFFFSYLKFISRFMIFLFLVSGGPGPEDFGRKARA